MLCGPTIDGMECVDAVVVGAGVVGLAVARALAQSGREVLVLEREARIGSGISARNSEVIHAGLYYPVGSLKAQFCARGRDLLYAYCLERGVEHRRVGKLVVATDASQVTALQALAARAQALGVPGLQILDRDAARALEPALRCEAAMLSPTTGIIDAHGLMLALQGDLEHRGGLVVLRSTVESLRRDGGAWVLAVQDDAGQGSVLGARAVINAAGLFAAGLAARTEGLQPRHRPRMRFAKGHYFALSGRSPFSRLIYPMPQDGGLGVHLTLDLAGQARFGPDVQWLAPDCDPGMLDYRVDGDRAAAFAKAVRAYWPELADDALQPAYSGVRPKLSGPGEPAADFRVDGPAQHGLPGLVNLFGIESPGLTACLAIAEGVLKRL